MMDPAVRAVKEAVDIPIVGAGEAARRIAPLLGIRLPSFIQGDNFLELRSDPENLSRIVEECFSNSDCLIVREGNLKRICFLPLPSSQSLFTSRLKGVKSGKAWDILCLFSITLKAFGGLSRLIWVSDGFTPPVLCV